MIDTDNWPFIEARWFTKWPGPGRRPVRIGVIHAMQFYERGDTAEVIARDFARRPKDNQGSVHVNIDNNSFVQSVKDNDIAYGAKGANRDAIHIELAGFAEQTRAQWLDAYGHDLLRNAGSAVAQYSLKYNLPLVHLTNEQLLNGAKGWVGHNQVTEVYKVGTHTDPGPNFPWDVLMAEAAHAYERRKLQFGIA